MTTPHVAFRSSDTLHHRTSAYIQRMRHGDGHACPEEVEVIMATFIDEALDTFLIGAAEAAGLSPGMLRVVNMTSQTISKASNLVISRSARKMNQAQHRAAADYMDQVRQPGPQQAYWYVAFPISTSLAESCHALPELCCGDNLTLGRQALARYLLALTDESLDWYFERPMALLNFGPILHKVASMGVETSRKATHSLINSLVPRLNEQQLLASAYYQASMLVSLPLRQD